MANDLTPMTPRPTDPIPTAMPPQTLGGIERPTVSRRDVVSMARDLGVPVADLVAGLLGNEEMKADVIRAINLRLNIPIIGEGAEAVLIERVYDLISFAVNGVVQSWTNAAGR